MVQKKLILGFDGSPHKEGLCAGLLNKALNICKDNGADTEYVKLIDLQLPVFHGKYTDDEPKGHKDLWSKIRNSDGLIFATPVHWFNVSASMKNFIDWLTTLEVGNFYLEGKPVAILTTCEEDGGQKAINDITAPLMHHGAIFYPYSSLFFNINMNKNSENNWMNTDLELLAKNMVKATELLKHSPKGGWGY